MIYFYFNVTLSLLLFQQSRDQRSPDAVEPRRRQTLCELRRSSGVLDAGDENFDLSRLCGAPEDSTHHRSGREVLPPRHCLETGQERAWQWDGLCVIR